MGKLPSTWTEVTFEDVVDVNPPRSLDLSLDDAVTFVPMAAVNEVSGTITDSIVRPLREVSKGFTQFSENDVIFAKITPSMENGKSAIAIGLENGIGFGSTEFHVFRSTGAILPEYLWRFIRQKSFREDAQKVMSGAVGQQRVPASYLKAHPLPLPPLAEQRRIVAKIDSLISRTLRARNDLERISSLVEKYKIRLLSKIFSNASSPSISEEVIFDELVISAQNGISKRRGSVGRQVNVLRLADLIDGKFEGSNPRAIALTEIEEEKFRLQAGDLLCIRVNGSEHLVGRMLAWNSDENWAFCDHFIRYSLDTKKIIPEYAQYYFATEKVRNLIEKSFVSTAGQKTVNQNMIGRIPIPLPSKAIQTEIVRRINNAFSWLNRVSADQAISTKLLPKLEATIFSKAFRGELVTQDPNDEPTGTLLARIRAENDAKPKKPQQGRMKDRLMIKDPKTLLLQDCDNWPDKGLPFEEVSKRNQIPYDTLRDAVFALLAEEKPRLRQLFDEQDKCIYLKRVKE